MLGFRVNETTVSALNAARFRVFCRFCSPLARGLPFSVKRPFAVWTFWPFLCSVRARLLFCVFLWFSLGVFLASCCFVHTKHLALAWFFELEQHGALACLLSVWGLTDLRFPNNDPIASVLLCLYMYYRLQTGTLNASVRISPAANAVERNGPSNAFGCRGLPEPCHIGDWREYHVHKSSCRHTGR